MSATLSIQRFLILDDDPDYRRLLLLGLRRHFGEAAMDEYDPLQHGIPAPGFDWSIYDVLLLDYNLGIEGATGLDVLERFGGQADFPAVVMLTGAGNEEISVRAMKAGVHDYLRKQTLKLDTMQDLAEAIIDACARRRMQRVRDNALEAARQVAKLEARKIYGEYMAKYKAAQRKEEARMLAEREKLKAQLEKHLKLLTAIEKSKREAEAARQHAQEELERLEAQSHEVKATLDSNALKLLQQQRQAAELRLERTQNEVKEVVQEQKAVEDALAKSRWKLEQQADIQSQLEDDLEIVMDSPDAGAQAAAKNKQSARNAVDDMFDDIASQLHDKGPE